MITGQELDEQLARYIEISEQIKKLEEEKDYIKQLAEMYLAHHNLEEVSTEDEKIKVVSITATRENVNKDLLLNTVTPDQYAEIVTKKSYSFVKIQTLESMERQRSRFKKGDSDGSATTL